MHVQDVNFKLRLLYNILAIFTQYGTLIKNRNKKAEKPTFNNLLILKMYDKANNYLILDQ